MKTKKDLISYLAPKRWRNQYGATVGHEIYMSMNNDESLSIFTILERLRRTIKECDSRFVKFVPSELRDVRKNEATELFCWIKEIPYEEF